MKKTFTTLALALVLTFGATFANAGIIVSDLADGKCQAASTDKDGIIIFGKDGIIIFGKDGIIIFGITVYGTGDKECSK